jgi:small-conductance mechanosensitive channel
MEADSLIRVLSELKATVSRLEETLVTGGSQITSADTAGTTLDEGVLRRAARGQGSLLLKVIWSVIVIGLTLVFLRFSAWLLDALAERRSSRRLFFKRLIPIVRALAWATVVYHIVAGVFNVDRQGLIAAGAAIGVAVGFAAQDLLKNVFGGLLILFDQPFQVGDRVAIGGSYGEVVAIGLRSTRIVTPEDSLVTVPNAQVVDSQVSNANAGALDCQVVTNLYVSSKADAEEAKRIAHEAAINSTYVYLKKPVVVLVKDEYVHNFVTKIIVKAYVFDARFEAMLASDITEEARRHFRAEGWLPEQNAAEPSEMRKAE